MRNYKTSFPSIQTWQSDDKGHEITAVSWYTKRNLWRREEGCTVHHLPKISGNFGWEFPFVKNITGCLTFTQNLLIDAQRLTRSKAERAKRPETRTKYVKGVISIWNVLPGKTRHLFRIFIPPGNFPVEWAKRSSSTLHLNQNFREFLVNNQGPYLPSVHWNIELK